jgi:energy-coupling factor transporter transmembrane protein EcfT
VSSLIAYYPGKTFMHKLDPRAKIIFMVLVSMAIFAVQQISVALVVMGVMVFLWLLARLPFKVLWSFIKVLLPIMGFLFVVQAIFYPGNTPLIKPLIPIGKGYGQITLDGMLFAVLLALRLMAMIIMLPLVNFTTPVQNFALGMVKMGMPYKLAYTMTTALNLVPILQGETGVIGTGHSTGNRLHAPGAAHGCSHGFARLWRQQIPHIPGRYPPSPPGLGVHHADHPFHHRDDCCSLCYLIRS